MFFAWFCSWELLTAMWKSIQICFRSILTPYGDPTYPPFTLHGWLCAIHCGTCSHTWFSHSTSHTTGSHSNQSNSMCFTHQTMSPHGCKMTHWKPKSPQCYDTPMMFWLCTNGVQMVYIEWATRCNKRGVQTPSQSEVTSVWLGILVVPGRVQLNHCFCTVKTR